MGEEGRPNMAGLFASDSFASALQKKATATAKRNKNGVNIPEKPSKTKSTEVSFSGVFQAPSMGASSTGSSSKQAAGQFADIVATLARERKSRSEKSRKPVEIPEQQEEEKDDDKKSRRSFSSKSLQSTAVSATPRRAFSLNRLQKAHSAETTPAVNQESRATTLSFKLSLRKSESLKPAGAAWNQEQEEPASIRLRKSTSAPATRVEKEKERSQKQENPFGVSLRKTGRQIPESGQRPLPGSSQTLPRKFESTKVQERVSTTSTPNVKEAAASGRKEPNPFGVTLRRTQSKSRPHSKCAEGNLGNKQQHSRKRFSTSSSSTLGSIKSGISKRTGSTALSKRFSGRSTSSGFSSMSSSANENRHSTRSTSSTSTFKSAKSGNSETSEQSLMQRFTASTSQFSSKTLPRTMPRTKKSETLKQTNANSNKSLFKLPKRWSAQSTSPSKPATTNKFAPKRRIAKDSSWIRQASSTMTKRLSLRLSGNRV